MCNFESGTMCGWTSTSGVSEWMVGKSSDGPTLDYSEQLPSGKYLFTLQKKFAAKRSVTSPVYSSAGPYCSFTAEYYIGGDHPTKPTIDVSCLTVRSCLSFYQ